MENIPISEDNKNNAFSEMNEGLGEIQEFISEIEEVIGADKIQELGLLPADQAALRIGEIGYAENFKELVAINEDLDASLDMLNSELNSGAGLAETDKNAIIETINTINGLKARMMVMIDAKNEFEKTIGLSAN